MLSMTITLCLIVLCSPPVSVADGSQGGCEMKDRSIYCDNCGEPCKANVLQANALNAAAIFVKDVLLAISA